MKKLILLLFGLTLLVNINAQNPDSLKHADYLQYVKTAEEGTEVKVKVFGFKRIDTNTQWKSYTRKHPVVI